MTERPSRLELGAQVVELLLPHSPPLLMVDRVVAFSGGPRPSLIATRCISANEPALAGHFRSLKIWPGIFTIEGMGQSCQLLMTIDAIADRFVAEGSTDGDALAALRNLDAGYRLEPGYRAAEGEALLQRLKATAGDLGLSASVDVRFLRPVFPGCRLEYRVSRTHDAQGVLRFDVEAVVGGGVVARGRMGACRLAAAVPGTAGSWSPTASVREVAC